MSAMNAYSIREYEDLVARMRSEHPEQRTGQVYFNALFRIRADLATKVRGDQTIDPFHNNRNVPAFREWLYHNWEDDE